jgi:hypothetical protein
VVNKREKRYALFGSSRIGINLAHLFFLRTGTVSDFYATVFLLLSIDTFIIASCKIKLYVAFYFIAGFSECKM